MPTSRAVIVSILNWNTAAMTAECVQSVLQMQQDDGVQLSVIVIDNGSAAADWALLQKSIASPQVELIRQERNLGFAGGHNVAIDLALARNADFIWLINSDSLLAPDAMTRVLALMDADPRCGAASPVVTAQHDESKIDFCGAQRDWKNLESIRAGSVAQARQMEADTPDDMWLAGTVVMFRMAALRAVGPLNAHLFAYFEDDDIGVRLTNGGWRSRMVFDARAVHAQPDVKERPAHYFYLLYRNSFLFYLAFTPKRFRRLIRWRLIVRTMFTANRLMYKGQPDKANACMLGAMDGLAGRGGAPDLQRQASFGMQSLRRLLLLKQRRWIKRLEG
jgi:GT2 family glycosyltransferase